MVQEPMQPTSIKLERLPLDIRQPVTETATFALG